MAAGKTDYRKTENRTIRLTILGATENLPLALSGYGKDCNGGDGYYAYVAAPQQAKGLLIHEVPGPEGKTFHAWKAGSKDNPPDLSVLDKQKTVTAAQAQAGINAMQKLGTTRPVGSGTAAKSILRGKWTGYIECHKDGPRVVLTRDVAQYTSLALVSIPGKGWDYAIHVKNLAGTNWFTSGSSKAVRNKGGIKSKSLTGKTRGTLKAAFNAAIADLFGLVAQACSVRDTHRPAALSATEQTKANVRATTRAAKKGKAAVRSAPLTATEATAYRKSRAKLAKMTPAEKRIAAQVKRDRGPAAKPVPESIAALKGTYRKITKGQNEGNAGTVLSVKRDGKGYLLTFRIKGATVRVQKTSTRAATKPTAAGGSKAKTGGRIRSEPVASQKKLPKRFAMLNDNAGGLKGKAVFIKSAAANKRGDYDPRHGGALLTVLIPGKSAISERTINEYKQTTDGPVSVLSLSGGKSVFQAAVKEIGYSKGADGKTKWTDKSLIRMADALNANGMLANAGIKLGTNDKKRVAKARAAIKAKAEGSPAKPATPRKRKVKPQVSGPAASGPTDAELDLLMEDPNAGLGMDDLLLGGDDDEDLESVFGI